MASEAELHAIENVDLGKWLGSRGMHELVARIYSGFLEQDDIDSLVTSPEQRTKLMAAVYWIEGIQSGEISAEGAGAGGPEQEPEHVEPPPAGGVLETTQCMKADEQQPDSKTGSVVAATRPQQSPPPMDGPQKKEPRAPAAPAPAQPTPDGLAAPEAEGEGQSPEQEQEQEQEPEQRPDPTVAPPEQGPPKSKTLSKTEPKPGGKIHRVDPQVQPAV